MFPGGDLNFASRMECRKCTNPKPYDPNRDTQSHQKMKPGDWICTNCQDLNYGSRDQCRKCNTAKPGGNNGASGGMDPGTLNAVLS